MADERNLVDEEDAVKEDRVKDIQSKGKTKKKKRMPKETHRNREKMRMKREAAG